MMSPMQFREIRKQLGLSQEAMGQALGGYSKTCVYLWEAGKRNIDGSTAILMLLLKKHGLKILPVIAKPTI